MGVVDSLSAGYRFLTRHLYLILFPIGLDLLLWLMPRLTVTSVTGGIADFYTEMAALEDIPQEMSGMMEQTATLMAGVGERVNLFDFLVSSSLLHVPSIMIVLEPLPTARLVDIAGWGQVFGLSILFGVIGVLLGVFYMSLLAAVLPLGNAAKPSGWGDFLTAVVRHWLRLVAFVAIMVVGVALSMIPLGMAVALVSLLLPIAGGFLMVLAAGFLFVLFFYLTFVAPAVIVDDFGILAAMGQSLVLVRGNFWPTLGFLLLTSVIGGGFSLLLAPAADFGAPGVVVAIVVNAFIGSGLAMAFLVFYRTRLLRLTSQEPIAA